MEGWRQETVSDATVLVAGIGALGCEQAKNLALAGIGKLVRSGVGQSRGLAVQHNQTLSGGVEPTC